MLGRAHQSQVPAIHFLFALVTSSLLVSPLSGARMHLLCWQVSPHVTGQRKKSVLACKDADCSHSYKHALLDKSIISSWSFNAETPTKKILYYFYSHVAVFMTLRSNCCSLSMAPMTLTY